MNEKFKFDARFFFILTVFSIIIFLCLKDIYIKSIVGRSNDYIIAKFILKEESPKLTGFHFVYHYNNKKVTVTNSGINDANLDKIIIDNLKINSFYLAKFDPRYPHIIIVNPTKHVTDTLKILKAGFSKEDL